MRWDFSWELGVGRWLGFLNWDLFGIWVLGFGIYLKAGLRRPFLFAVVAAVVLLLYAHTAGFDFVRADDADLIGANQEFLSSVRNAPLAFTRSYFEVAGQPSDQKTYYRPLTIVSFMVDARRGGANPRPYHVTNVVMHAAATCLLLALALAWGAREWAAFAAALLFAVHPVNVQAVAWIAGRNDLLVAIFGLLSLLAFARPMGAARAVGHVAAFAAALFSKETGIVFPLVAALHRVMVRGERMTRADRVAVVCDAVVVVAWALARGQALGGATANVPGAFLFTAAANLPQVFVQAGKMVAPLRLSVSPGVDGAGVALGVAAVGVLAWLAWSCTERRLAIVTAIWIVAALLPTLTVPGLPVYEHRVYVPLIALLAGGAVAAGSRIGPRHPIANVAVAVVVVVFAVMAYRRELVFRDPFTYWTDGTRDAQFGPIAHVNLGQLYEAAGQPADARREYLRALERDPNTPKAHNNLGVVLMKLGETELAREHFRSETERHPANPDGWFNLGLWSEEHGHADEARRYYLRAIAADRHFAPAQEKLAR
jgi:hypothetical protein